MPLSNESLRGTARRHVLGLIGVTILVHLAFSGGRVGLTLFAIELKASNFVVGLMVSLLSVVPMVLSVHLGRWTDRVGIKQPALISTGGVALACLLPWLHPGIATLCVASVLLGSSFMLLHIGVNNAVGHASTPATRASAFTWLAVGFSVSTVLGPVVAGYAIDHMGHARAFLVLASFPALMFVTLLLRKSSPQARKVPERPADAHVLDLLRDKPMATVFIVSVLINVSWDMFTFMMPVYGAQIRLPASSIGLIMGSFGMATLVVRLCLPWLNRYLTEWGMLAAALATSALSYALFPLITSFPLLLGLAFFLGLGLGSAQPMVLSLIHQVAPAGRTGEAIGVRTSFLNLSQVLMPMLFGAFSAGAGMVPAFWLMSAVGAGGSWFAGHGKDRHLPHQIGH
jgi:MFS family permease